jgi:hypothetical protein
MIILNNKVNITNMESLEKLYNLAKLREMLDGDEVAVISMVKKFIKTTPLFLNELTEYTKKGDYEKARKMLYNVNFSLDILGITSLRDELKFIEQYTSDFTKSNELKDLIDKLEIICEKVFSQLEEYLHEN